MYDLLIQGGRVIDPSQDIDTELDVGVNGDLIARLDPSIPSDQAATRIDASGLIVTPGLIDIHVHFYEGVSHFGIHADTHCINKGVTTAVDAGSSGAQTFPGFRKYIVEVSQTRLLAFLNLSAIGMVSELAGELQDLRYADTKAALRMIEANRDVILGIKVRMEPDFLAENGREVLRLARETSDAAGLPVMFHIGNTSPPLPEILKESKNGDVITHCYHSRPGGILDEGGRVLPQAYKAAQRGVNFDIGHGRGSFSYQVARQAMAQDFYPGTISTDLHIYNIDGPVFDLATTMSKFLYLGMDLPEVVSLATEKPARVVSMPDRIGTLRPGAFADLTLMELIEEPKMLDDAGWGVPVETVQVDRYLKPVGVVKGGKVIFFNDHE